MFDNGAWNVKKGPEAGSAVRWRDGPFGALSFRHGLPEFAIIFASASLILTTLAVRTTLLTYQNPNFRQPWDHHKYIRMAQGDPFAFHIAPFSWRVVTPLLAKILPLSLEWNFFLIAFLSIALTGVMVYYITRRLGAAQDLAFVAMLLFFALGVTTKATLSDFWLTDPLTMLVATSAILCILVRNDLLFVLLLTLGEGVRETIIFVAPLYYTLNARRLIDPRLALKTILFALPPLAVFEGLRIFIPEMNSNTTYIHGLPRSLRIQSGGRSTYSEATNVLQIVHHPLARIKYSLPGVANFVRNCLVALPFLPFVRNWMLVLRFAPYALLLYFQILVMGSTARYLLDLYPIVVVLAADGMSALSTRLRIPTPYFAALPVLFIILNLLDVSDRDAAGLLQLAALAAWLLMLLGVASSRARSTNEVTMTAE